MKPISLSILIPTYNNEDTIKEVIIRADKTAKLVAKPYEIVVVNDGSTDKTAPILYQLAKQLPYLRVITHTVNQGYGETIRKLYYAGTYDWLFSLPGDFQIDPIEVKKLLPYTKTADIIIGLRRQRNDQPNRLLQSRVYNSLLSFLFDLNLSDVNSVRLMRRSLIQSIHLRSQTAFVDAQLAIEAKRKGSRTIEVPIAHRSRAGEGATGGNIRKTIVPTIIDMIRYYFEVL